MVPPDAPHSPFLAGENPDSKVIRRRSVPCLFFPGMRLDLQVNANGRPQLQKVQKPGFTIE